MEIGNGFDIPVPPTPTGHWCGYPVQMKPCNNDACNKLCIMQNLSPIPHGWHDVAGMCTDIPAYKDCYCVHQCP